MTRTAYYVLASSVSGKNGHRSKNPVMKKKTCLVNSGTGLDVGLVDTLTLKSEEQTARCGLDSVR